MSIRIGNFSLRAFIASGAMNFYGQGWWWHLLLNMMPGFNYNGACIIGKTTTIDPRRGNMPLRSNYQPKEIFPRCVVVRRKDDSVLNSVGLSGPGAEELFRHPGWTEVKPPFVYSFMSVAASYEEKVREAKNFVNLIMDLREKNECSFPKGDGIALEINVSCPNAGHDTCALMEEITKILEQFQGLKQDGIVRAIFLKVNALTPIEVILKIQKSYLCDAIDCSNTIPWGELPDRIPWANIFGSDKSPLAKFNFGNGGLSGKYLLPIVADWIKEARDNGVHMPIIAGGGILKPKDVLTMKKAGADAIALGTVFMLRPWNVKAIIKEAKNTF